MPNTVKALIGVDYGNGENALSGSLRNIQKRALQKELMAQKVPSIGSEHA